MLKCNLFFQETLNNKNAVKLPNELHENSRFVLKIDPVFCGLKFQLKIMTKKQKKKNKSQEFCYLLFSEIGHRLRR